MNENNVTNVESFSDVIFTIVMGMFAGVAFVAAFSAILLGLLAGDTFCWIVAFAFGVALIVMGNTNEIKAD